MNIILQYFPDLKASQKERFEHMIALYTEWNDKINVVSRKDIDQLAERHILHSLAIAKFKKITVGSSVLDVGTGGGFPGIPLAVLFPKSNFHLVDSIGKKIRVVQEVSDALELDNVEATHSRVEDLKDQYDFIVSRAVAPTMKLLGWTKHLTIKNKTEYLLLKGGDLTEELKPTGFRATQTPISKYFKEPFFETKKVVYIKAY